MVTIKRAYEKASKSDGYRILVDRLWPRGVSKEEAALDLWLKDIAPSTELRKWFGHDPKRWVEFEKRYRAELKEKKELIADLRKVAKEHKITLVYSAKDEEHNQAVVLRDYINK